jgi:hypothetical protein
MPTGQATSRPSDVSDVEPLRHARVSVAARRILTTQGESGRFEFKADSKAATATVLVAAANWVALEPSREFVTILIGVEEVVDADTGLTTGRPVRLSGNDLSTHVRRVQDFAASTRPTPVDVRIIEEGVKTASPFLRVEVRPTFAPHFDGAGRRVTRHGASTRALEDEELLEIYLDREARQFEARFRATAEDTMARIDSMRKGLGGMAETLEHLPGLISGAESAAQMAGYEAEDTKRDIRNVQERLEVLERRLAERLNQTPETVFFRLRYARRRAWRCFNVDRVLKPTKAATALAPSLLKHLNQRIDQGSYLVNLAEAEHWESVLDERARPASARWWKDQLALAVTLTPDVGQLELVEDLESFEKEFDQAECWRDIELDPWATDEF